MVDRHTCNRIIFHRRVQRTIVQDQYTHNQLIHNKLILSEYVQNIISNDILKVPKNPPGGNFTIKDGRQYPIRANNVSTNCHKKAFLVSKPRFPGTKEPMQCVKMIFDECGVFFQQTNAAAVITQKANFGWNTQIVTNTSYANRSAMANTESTS